MALTIDEESKQASLQTVDIDKHRIRYQSRELDPETNTDVVIKFVSPSIYLYDKFQFYFLKNSVIKDLSPRNFFRPDYVSYEEYGTTILWTLILYINNIATIEEFNIPRIYIPTMESIYHVAKQSTRVNPTILSPVQTLTSRISSKIYTKESQPELRTPADVVETTLPDLYFIRQTFDMTMPIVTQQYVDLTFEAIAESIVFKIKDKSAFLYGRDYILVEGNTGKKDRVSWADSDVTGDGLIDIIEEGMVLEIQYAKEV